MIKFFRDQTDTTGLLTHAASSLQEKLLKLAEVTMETTNMKITTKTVWSRPAAVTQVVTASVSVTLLLPSTHTVTRSDTQPDGDINIFVISVYYCTRILHKSFITSFLVLDLKS